MTSWRPLLIILDLAQYLVSQSLSVRVAAVVEEGHGGEDGPAHRNDVELGDVVVLEDALRDLQPVGADHLQVLQQE